MTKPGIEPRNIEMRVEHSNHFTITALIKMVFATTFVVFAQ
jgi:hypothetical protein